MAAVPLAGEVAGSAPGSAIAALHFGAPDLPPRALANLLLRLVRESRAGDCIDWVTYYFRDRQLARALMDASDRGVSVSLLVEGVPRRREANAAVFALLEAHGLAGGLRISASRGERWRLHTHLHAKVYVFTGHRNLALIGSFNPSGDEPEVDPDVIREICDQDRGHNMLVEITDAGMVGELQRQARFWHGRTVSPWLRFRPMQNRVLHAPGLSVRFFPRLRTWVLEAALAHMHGGRISGALSHVKAGAFTRALCAAAARGVAVDLIVHDTERRVPEAMIARLHARGVGLRRYRHAEGLPVHSKFLLLERPGFAQVWFGSFNFNRRSRRFNVELLAESTDVAVIAQLRERFALLDREVAAQAQPAG